MDLAQACRAVPLGDPDRHAAALTLLATRALRAGQPADALELMDRRCRISLPGAADLAVRALAARHCGLSDAAGDDLARAEAADPLDPFVAMTRLRLAANGADALSAARRLAGVPDASPDALRTALAHLFGAGERAHAELDLVDGRLTGYAAFPPGRRATLCVLGLGESLSLPLVPDPDLPFSGEDFDVCLVEAQLGLAAHGFRLEIDGEVLAQGRLWPRRAAALEPPPILAPARVPDRAPLAVIVPVHGDLGATRDCLGALLAETAGRDDVLVVVVDDAAPEPEIGRLLSEIAATGAIRLVRNEANLGFAEAVRRGLDEAAGRDVLLLNADAVLPPGAIDRLAGAAYGAPDIGTVTPFSNNGEYTSLPRPGEAHPPPPPEEAVRIDAVAARVNAGLVTDLPNGVGFCLYVRRDCLAAVGTMPSVYLRGYFEDVEFCLRARRAGYRNVCASSVYVLHHGSLSFGSGKRALVARNLAVLRSRYPSFQAECAAYAMADPLAGARAAILAGLPSPPSAGAARPTVHAAARPEVPRPPSLGLREALPSPEGDAFIGRLSAALRLGLPEARIVVLGRALDDLALMGRGNVFVTGPIGEEELLAAALRHGVAALALPHPACPDLPSFPFGSAIAGPPQQLITDSLAHVRPKPQAIVDWFADRLQAPSAQPGPGA